MRASTSKSIYCEGCDAPVRECRAERVAPRRRALRDWVWCLLVVGGWSAAMYWGVPWREVFAALGRAMGGQ